MADRIRYYTDENVANAVAEGLRRLGIDVVTTPEAALISAADETQLNFAADNGRVIFTQDVDFIDLAFTRPGHAGVVYADRSHSIGQIVRALAFSPRSGDCGRNAGPFGSHLR